MITRAQTRPLKPAHLIQCAIALLLSTFMACASIDAQSTQYVGLPHYPPTDPAKIQIIRPPAQTRPFDKIGEIQISASVDPAAETKDIEAKLRAEAAKLGADAILITYDQILPPGAFIPGGPQPQSSTARRLIGIALKFK